MRSEFIYALLALGLAATPALAASASNDNSATKTSPSLSTSSPSASDQSGAGALQGNMQDQSSAGGMQSQTALQQSLQQAGFKDVHITARSYVVHAKGPDGSPVVMMITPDSITGIVANPQSAQAPGLDQGNNNNGLDQNQNGGGFKQQD